MTRSLRSLSAADPSTSGTGTAARVSVLVCRGCCCGTEAKHPTVDHDGQLEAIRGVADEIGARLWTVDCLGPCERSNVVVVRSGAERRWFGSVLDEDKTADLASWVRSGAGLPLPASLQTLEFDPAASLPLELEEIRRGRDVVDLLVGAFDRGGATLTAGSHGAVAALPSAPAQALVVEGGRWLRLRRPGGEMVLDLGHPELRVFGLAIPGVDDAGFPMLVLAARGDRSTSGTVQELGPDVDALSPSARTEVLYDLGIGHAAARFCVRGEPGTLGRLLDPVVGRAGLDVITELGPELVALDPARVVVLPFGRIEITTPIPAPGDVSPDGPHTHVLPEQLALGLAGPPELSLPDGLLPAAIVHLRPNGD